MVRPKRASSSYHNQEVLKPRNVSCSRPEKGQVAAPKDVPDLNIAYNTHSTRAIYHRKFG